VKELNEAKVLAVGPGGFDKDGKRIAMGVKAGDKVLIPQVRYCAFFGMGAWKGRRLEPRIVRGRRESMDNWRD
jgi:hypothetical protein